MLSSLVFLLVAAPDWVKAGGSTPRFPASAYLVGFAVVDRADAEASAKNQAAADLASRISLRIESTVSDVAAEKDGVQRYEIAAATKASTDVRLAGLAFETFVDAGKTYALAVLERAKATAERRAERDQSLARAEQGLAAGPRQKEVDALKTYFNARLSVNEALEHEAVSRVLAGGKSDRPGFDKDAGALDRQLDERIGGLLKKPVASFADLADALALQLKQQSVGKADKWTISAPTYGTSTFSSAFGRGLIAELDRALIAHAAEVGGNRELVIKGTYVDAAELLRVVLVVREASTGKSVASAEAAVPKKALGVQLAYLPQNFQQALVDQKIMGLGEEISGNLRVEVFTNKGKSNLIYAGKEELRIKLRVNKPAWVQLVYALAKDGLKVPITQGYFIDESKVNMLVEYPDTFEISAPFGVERIFAIAQTEKPEPLPTKKINVDGEDYEVVIDAPKALVKHRGLKRVEKKKAEVADDVLTVTTTP